MSYQIFIPGGRGCDVAQLRAVGLETILDPEFGPSEFDVTSGPQGQCGACFAWLDTLHPERDPRRPGMHLDQQIWTPCKPRGGLAAGRFWLGRDKGRKIKPSDLARRTQQPGLPVKLDDGQEWLVPAAVRLPHRYALDAEGRESRQVVDRFREFYARAEHFYNVFLKIQVQPGVVVEGGWPFAIEALALNYRVNADLVDWLGLFSEEALLWTIGATFELDPLRAIELQKKTA
jgi:hypothetical protein